MTNMDKPSITLFLTLAGVLLLKIGHHSNLDWKHVDAYQNYTPSCINPFSFSAPSVIDSIPSLALHNSTQFLSIRSNQGLNFSNTNKRRANRKQNATMLLLIILLGGDVQVNPGPIKYPCGMCSRPVANNHRGLECDECESWVHIRCGDVTAKNYEMLLLQQSFTWICPKCALPNFSDSFFNESNLADKNLYDSLSDLDSSASGFTIDKHEIPQPISTSSPNKSQDQINGTKTGNDGNRPKAQKPQQKTKAKLKKGRFKFMTINVQGLKGKERQKYLATLIDEEKPDIIMGQESKLDDTYSDAEVFPDGFLVKRLDRNRYGGGVFIAYRDNLVVSELKNVGKSCELVVLKVEVWKSAPIYIVSFYRPTDRNPIPLKDLQAELEKLFNRKSTPKLLLCGDFNVPDISWQNYSIDDNPQYGLPVNEAMLDLVERFHLEQLVQVPTRLDNILDLILTTMPDSVSNIKVIPGMSDHEAVIAECETNIQRNKKKPRTVFIYRKANTEGMEHDLKQFSENFMSSHENRTCSENWELHVQGIPKEYNEQTHSY